MSQQKTYTSFDGDRFPYSQWGNCKTPSTIIIAVHGINGAACDYSGLGNYIEQHLPQAALYAPETRGQGNDPNIRRRGDIYHAQEWYKDLTTFSNIIRGQHPESKVVWCGESMGSLIVTHTLAEHKSSPSAPPLCDGLILLSPVVDLSHQIPAWKHRCANLISALFPRLRFSLTALSGEDAVKVTQGSDDHETQAATNSYWIPKFTLRLLSTLGNLIKAMPQCATRIDLPTLIINGGNDYFTPPQYVESFIHHFPNPSNVQHRYFPNAYHLLMYDEQRQEIFANIVEWIKNQPLPK